MGVFGTWKWPTENVTQSVGVGAEEGCKSRIVLDKRLLSHLPVTAISSDEDIVILSVFFNHIRGTYCSVYNTDLHLSTDEDVFKSGPFYCNKCEFNLTIAIWRFSSYVNDAFIKISALRSSAQFILKTFKFIFPESDIRRLICFLLFKIFEAVKGFFLWAKSQKENNNNNKSVFPKDKATLQPFYCSG